MKKAIKNILGSAYTRLILFNNPYYFFGIAKSDYQKSGSSVTLPRIGLTVDEVKGESVIRGYPHALKLKEALGAKFSLEGDAMIVTIGDLTFSINSAEEFFILYEVFIIQDYKYGCVRDTTFVDVGMNSGITTLYYAQQPEVTRIYSYELFAPTFRLGEKNLMRNAQYSSKVKAFNYGLSNRSYETTLDYSISRKGRMGLKGLPGDEQFSDTSKESVVVKDIAGIFEMIIAESGNNDIVVKMDCEGEEYNLIDRLSNAGLLDKVTAFMIEWHYTPPRVMEDQLKSAGFHVFSQTLPSLDSGMIHAGRRTR